MYGPRDCVKNMLKDWRVDIICLQETSWALLRIWSSRSSGVAILLIEFS